MNRLALAICLGVQTVAFALLAREAWEVNLGNGPNGRAWTQHEVTEVLAMVALFVGCLLALYLLLQSMRESRQVGEKLKLASQTLQDSMQTSFDAWDLTPTERENAILLVKGLSIADIARLRGKSEATVKAQNTRIYRKSGQPGRAQFVSHLYEATGRSPLADDGQHG